jgi:hypothetical protein
VDRFGVSVDALYVGGMPPRKTQRMPSVLHPEPLKSGSAVPRLGNRNVSVPVLATTTAPAAAASVASSVGEKRKALPPANGAAGGESGAQAKAAKLQAVGHVPTVTSSKPIAAVNGSARAPAVPHVTMPMQPQQSMPQQSMPQTFHQPVPASSVPGAGYHMMPGGAVPAVTSGVVAAGGAYGMSPIGLMQMHPGSMPPQGMMAQPSGQVGAPSHHTLPFVPGVTMPQVGQMHQAPGAPPAGWHPGQQHPGQ